MLTDTATRQAKPKDKPYKLSDEKGLYLEVHPNGSKYWRMKYRYGKEKRLSFGVYPDVSLKRAREKRADARELLADGIDPGEVKRAEKHRKRTLADDSFGAVAHEWFKKQEPHWSSSHSVRVEASIEKNLADLATRPIAEVTPPELLQTLDAPQD